MHSHWEAGFYQFEFDIRILTKFLQGSKSGDYKTIATFFSFQPESMLDNLRKEQFGSIFLGIVEYVMRSAAFYN